MSDENEHMIPRWLPKSEWSAADHFKALRGETPENPEYLKARREALEAAGFIDDESNQDSSYIDETNITSGEYLRQLQKGH